MRRVDARGSFGSCVLAVLKRGLFQSPFLTFRSTSRFRVSPRCGKRSRCCRIRITNQRPCSSPTAPVNWGNYLRPLGDFMKPTLLRTLLFVCMVSTVWGPTAGAEAPAGDYPRHIRPFLEKQCIDCHGADT